MLLFYRIIINLVLVLSPIFLIIRILSKKETLSKISKIVEKKLLVKYGRNYKTRKV